MTGGRGRHVAQHDIYLLRHALPQGGETFVTHEVALEQVRARHRLHFQKIDANNGAFALARPDDIHRDLCPAAWRRAEIDDLLAGFQEVKLLVKLLQLESRTGPVAELLRLDHVGVVKLPA